jgi:polyhydroxybutyrate depolymerase
LTGLLALAILPLSACGPEKAPRETIRYGSHCRTALVHVPPKQDNAGPLPLVIALHGILNTPENADKQTAFRELADREGFVVAYPDARMGVWNIFNSRRDADDIRFLSALIDQMVAKYQVDPARVYLTGTSNGGMMVHTVARVMPERFAAIAPAFGPLARSTERAGAPGVPMPTLIIYGTADNILRWGGGGSSGFGLPWYSSVPDMVAFWANNNGCSEVAESTDLPDIDPNDGTTASRTVYGGCTDGAEVVLYTVHGGGHNRPGTLNNPNGGYGAVCMDFNATEVTWAFFKTHWRTQPEQ